MPHLYLIKVGCGPDSDRGREWWANATGSPGLFGIHPSLDAMLSDPAAFREACVPEQAYEEFYLMAMAVPGWPASVDAPAPVNFEGEAWP